MITNKKNVNGFMLNKFAPFFGQIKQKQIYDAGMQSLNLKCFK